MPRPRPQPAASMSAAVKFQRRSSARYPLPLSSPFTTSPSAKPLSTRLLLDGGAGGIGREGEHAALQVMGGERGAHRGADGFAMIRGQREQRRTRAAKRGAERAGLPGRRERLGHPWDQRGAVGLVQAVAHGMPQER